MYHILQIELIFINFQNKSADDPGARGVMLDLRALLPTFSLPAIDCMQRSSRGILVEVRVTPPASAMCSAGHALQPSAELAQQQVDLSICPLLY